MCRDVLIEREHKNSAEIRRIEAPVHLDRPILTTTPLWEDGRGLRFFGGTIFLLLSILLITVNPAEILKGFFVLGAFLFAAISFSGILSAKKIADGNNENQRIYDTQMYYYEHTLKRELKNQKEETETVLPQLRSDLELYRKELAKCDELLRVAYDADVIPIKYRDRYVAVYLYDWFKHNRRADDMDLALNTFVLEEIKSRLDKMIELQRESIIQQRIMIVQQRTALEEQRRHNKRMENRVREIVANQEEQQQYLEMIESNTAATTFFAAAHYLEN